MRKKPKYKPIEKQIAAYIFAKPAMPRATILRHFATKCDTSEATVKRWYYNAMEIVKERQNKQQEAQDEVFVGDAKATAKNVIKSRNFYMSELENDFIRLGEIISGSAVKDVDKKTGTVIGFRQAGYNDEIQAKRSRVTIVQRMADIQGWNAPKQSDINIKQPVIKIEVTDDAIKQELTEFMSQ